MWILKTLKSIYNKKDLKNALDPYSTRKELENTTIELIKYIGEVKTELKMTFFHLKTRSCLK